MHHLLCSITQKNHPQTSYIHGISVDSPSVLCYNCYRNRARYGKKREYPEDDKDMDNTKRFNGHAKDYTIGRPNYAEELIDRLYDEYGFSENSVIADIGSGTGKFAKQLLERNSEVYCVEPNDDMRHTAEKELSGFAKFHSINGDAEFTTLKDRSVDLITTAQAFHWFDVSKFRKECLRIIKGSGKVFLIWNVREEDGLNKELYKIYTRYCHDFKGFSGGIVKDDPRIKEFFNGRYEYISYDNPLYYDKDRFIARSLSGSYSLKEGDTDYDKYLDAITETFEKYSDNGIITIANRSVAYIGSIE